MQAVNAEHAESQDGKGSCKDHLRGSELALGENLSFPYGSPWSCTMA